MCVFSELRYAGQMTVMLACNIVISPQTCSAHKISSPEDKLISCVIFLSYIVPVQRLRICFAHH